MCIPNSRSAGITKRNRHKLGPPTDLFYEFIFTYGIMLIIMLLSMALYYVHNVETGINNFEFWVIIVNSFSPTTITFIGVVLFSNNFSSQHKGKQVMTVFLVFGIALTYITCIGLSPKPPNQTAEAIYYLIMVVNIIFTVCSMFLVCGLAFGPPNGTSQGNADGRVSVERRVKS